MRTALIAAALAHDRNQGHLMTGSGAHSFRPGNFRQCKNQEQMRLIPDGKLGQRVTGPQAKHGWADSYFSRLNVTKKLSSQRWADRGGPSSIRLFPAPGRLTNVNPSTS